MNLPATTATLMSESEETKQENTNGAQRAIQGSFVTYSVNPRTRVMSPRLRPGGSETMGTGPHGQGTDYGQATDDSGVLEGQTISVNQRPHIPRLTGLENATTETQNFTLNQDSERTDRDTSPEPVWRLPCDICGEKNHSEIIEK